MPRSPKVHRPISYYAPGKVERQPLEVLRDRARPSRHARGYTNEWAQASREFLSANPLCVHCRARGIRRASTVTDHIRPHRGDPVLFWDPSNWQALCKPCHDRKTATVDRRSLSRPVPPPPPGVAQRRLGGGTRGPPGVT